MARCVSNREGQLPDRLQSDGLSLCGVSAMVVANVNPLPRFNLGRSVVSASSIRMIR